jgi:phospholipid/cholesterol/gamma-HCH transport system permease protein
MPLMNLLYKPMARFIDIQSNTLTLSGDWVLDNLAAIQTELNSLSKTDISTIDAEIDHLDTAGSLILQKLSQEIHVKINGIKEWQAPLLDLIDTEQEKPSAAPAPFRAIEKVFIHIGKHSIEAWNGFLNLLSFIGETTIRLGGLMTHPKRIRGISIIRHINETGVAAIPIVALIAFLISVVLAYQGSGQLRRFGAEIFTINMVAVSVLREMGVLLTAIMIAGRSGSAFTAEIGVMKVNEEVDAMRIIGIRPFEILVLPRLIALVITMPLLTFIADIMGLLGGGVISFISLDISPDQYLERCRAAIKMWDFWVGMIKAPVFGAVIAIVGCMRGMQVSGSAESVGRLTTISVVQSIFLVLLLDALFSILFTNLGI